MPHPTPSSSAPSLRSLSESLQKAKGSVLRGSRLVKSVGAKYSIPRIAEADGAVSDAAKTDVEVYPHRPSVELSDPRTFCLYLLLTILMLTAYKSIRNSTPHHLPKHLRVYNVAARHLVLQRIHYPLANRTAPGREDPPV